MHLRQHRSISILAATAAALALGAAPALAGENDDGDDDDEVAPAPAPSTGTSGGGSVPQGGVSTGAGGMAEHGSEALLLGLASGAFFLVLSGGRLVATARRDPS